MLVNDVHEILMHRIDKLHCLVPSDADFFDHIKAQRFNKGKLEEQCVLTIIEERLSMHMVKVRKRNCMDSAGEAWISERRIRARMSLDRDTAQLSPVELESHLHHTSTPLPLPIRAAMDAHRSTHLLHGDAAGTSGSRASLSMPPYRMCISQELQQMVLFTASCCASASSLLALYGLARNQMECHQMLHNLTVRALSIDHEDAVVVKTLPTFPLALLRCMIGSYTPTNDNVALHALLEPLDCEIQRRKHAAVRKQAQEQILTLSQGLRAAYSTTQAKHLLESLLHYSNDAMATTWRCLHDLKFPWYTYHSSNAGDSFLRQMCIKGTGAWQYQRAQFLFPMLGCISSSILGTGIAPPDDIRMLLGLVGSVRLLTTWVMWLALSSSQLLYDYTDDIEHLLYASSELQKLDQFLTLLPRPIHSTYYCVQLDLLLLLFTEENTSREFDRNIEIQKIAAAYSKLIEDLREQPDLGVPRRRHESFTIAPSMVMKYEQQVVCLACACRTLLALPEVYALSASMKNVSAAHVEQELRNLLARFYSFIMQLVDWYQQMACGCFSLSIFHIAFQTYRALQRRMRRLPSSELVELSIETLNALRQLLALLSRRFALAFDLVEMLDSFRPQQEQYSNLSHSMFMGLRPSVAGAGMDCAEGEQQRMERRASHSAYASV
jgi:hypothetical protein